MRERERDRDREREKETEREGGARRVGFAHGHVGRSHVGVSEKIKPEHFFLIFRN